MGFAGFDELSSLIKGMPGSMHFAKTSEDSAGVGYSTRAPKNRHDNFHVKWHPVMGTNVVDRFHVKNEYLGKSIYYSVSMAKALSYFKAGPNGDAVSWAFYDYNKDLLEDCDSIANTFLNKIYHSPIKVYDKQEDAQLAYEKRQESEKSKDENRNKKNDLAVAYARLWPKLSQSDKQQNPQYSAVKIREFSLDEVQKIYDHIVSLLPPGSVPEESKPKMVVPLPMPPGFVASPGSTAIVEKAPLEQGTKN